MTEILVVIIVALLLIVTELVFVNNEMKKINERMVKRYEVSELLIDQLQVNSKIQDDIIAGYKRIQAIEESICNIN